MKALTLTQPWATLVAIGAKRYETRSWLTHYRGRIAIHAGAGLGPVGGEGGLYRLCSTEPFRSVLEAEAGIRTTEDLPRGEIVAIADLLGCYPTTAAEGGLPLAADEGLPLELAEHERAFGDWSEGRFVFALAKVLQVHDGPSLRGWQKIWNLPPATAAALGG